jgi:putative addiction module component (TIGR02574 family)
MSTDGVLAEVLRLSRAERAKVAQALLDSLEEPDEAVTAGWGAELERRSRDIADGRVQTLSWEATRSEILKELEQRRAGRASS